MFDQIRHRIKDVDNVVEPVTVSEAKTQVKELPIDAEDALVAKYIKAARRNVEESSERLLVDKTVLVQLDNFPSANERIKLPVITESAAITKITYTDTNGESQVIQGTEIKLANIPTPNYIYKTDGWPTGSDVIIEYIATKEDAHVDGLVIAILLTVAHYYLNRTITDVGRYTNVMNVIKAHRRYTSS